VSEQRWLDPLAVIATDVGRSFEKVPRLDAIARGRWLGHPLHPALTDLPIGFWTSAMLVDVVGGTAGATTARRLIAWGNATAVPAAIAGFADARDRPARERRVAGLHAALNVAGVAAYVASSMARRRDRRGFGIAVSFVGATLLTASAHLGGHLAFGGDTPSDG
jgi:uncharacterized membrane protein